MSGPSTPRNVFVAPVTVLCDAFNVQTTDGELYGHKVIYYSEKEKVYTTIDAEQQVPTGYARLTLKEITCLVDEIIRAGPTVLADKTTLSTCGDYLLWMGNRKIAKAYDNTVCGYIRWFFSCLQNLLSGYGFQTSAERALAQSKELKKFDPPPAPPAPAAAQPADKESEAAKKARLRALASGPADQVKFKRDYLSGLVKDKVLTYDKSIPTEISGCYDETIIQIYKFLEGVELAHKRCVRGDVPDAGKTRVQKLTDHAFQFDVSETFRTVKSKLPNGPDVPSVMVSLSCSELTLKTLLFAFLQTKLKLNTHFMIKEGVYCVINSEIEQDKFADFAAAARLSKDAASHQVCIFSDKDASFNQHKELRAGPTGFCVLT